MRTSSRITCTLGIVSPPTKTPTHPTWASHSWPHYPHPLAPSISREVASVAAVVFTSSGLVFHLYPWYLSSLFLCPRKPTSSALERYLVLSIGPFLISAWAASRPIVIINSAFNDLLSSRNLLCSSLVYRAMPTLWAMRRPQPLNPQNEANQATYAYQATQQQQPVSVHSLPSFFPPAPSISREVGRPVAVTTTGLSLASRRQLSGHTKPC
jgi:hypothetical protein